MKRRLPLFYLLAAILVSLVPSSGWEVHAQDTREEPPTKTPIKHFIVLMQENHSFDNYFGTYPGANGIPDGTCMPVDPFDKNNTECVEAFHIGDHPIEDLDHSSATAKLQYNNGLMNGFVYALNLRNQDGASSMGYYNDNELPYYWNIADEYVLFDNFFSSANGGSVANHMFWVAGVVGKDGEEKIPDDGYGDIPTIFDRLQERGISWKFYVQNYDPSINYRTVKANGLPEGLGNRASQVVWVPLLNYARYLDDPELSSHIVDLEEYYTDLENDTLPAVSFIVPAGASEHPPGSIRSGQKFVKSLLQALMRSDAWSTSLFTWTYDDWGGWYDHVPPPKVDEFGYGFRVPALLVSAYARRGYVDSTQLDFTSYLKFIEENWDLKPLATRDAQANSIVSALDFTQPPRKPFFLQFSREADKVPAEPRRSAIYIAYGAALVLATSIFTFASITDGRSVKAQLRQTPSRKRKDRKA
jgi:phospholipase C